LGYGFGFRRQWHQRPCARSLTSQEICSERSESSIETALIEIKLVWIFTQTILGKKHAELAQNFFANLSCTRPAIIWNAFAKDGLTARDEQALADLRSRYPGAKTVSIVGQALEERRPPMPQFKLS